MPVKYEGELNPRAADVAASAQLVLEDIVKRILARVDTRRKTLCIGGGVAQNSVLNGRLALTGDYDVVHVPPWVTDAGTAIGAAAYAAHQDGFEPIVPEHDYWGPGYDDHAISSALKRINIRATRVAEKQVLLDQVAV